MRRALRNAAQPLDCGTPGGDVTAHPPLSHRTAPLVDALTERSRRVWSAGDYDRISAGFRDEARAFVERRGLERGQEVLDAACGSGNLTIPAAHTGAHVTGIDLVPELLEATAGWARLQHVRVTLRAGTVEDMPFGDAQFDVVLSMFGLMFAARPERVMAELARLTRPGGQVALANWTRAGFVGQMLALHVAYAPPPAQIPSPLLWGDEKTIRERFDARLWNVTVAPRTLTFRYPYTPAGTAELFRTAYGPTVRTFEALDEDRRASLGSELAAHWIQHQRPSSSTTEVDAEYLEVVATRL